MKKLTQIFEFINDYLLASFFVLIIGGAFFGSLALSPIATNLNGTNQVLGESLGGFSIINNIPVEINFEYSETDSSKSFVISPQQLLKGENKFTFITLVNNTEISRKIILSTNIAENYKQGIEYKMLSGEYQFLLSEATQEYELDIDPGARIDLELVLTADTQINYPIEFEVLLEEFRLDTLP